jgi:hypothetical protein
MVLVFLSMTNYMVDSYLMYAASALAANAVLRSIFGAVLWVPSFFCLARAYTDSDHLSPLFTKQSMPVAVFHLFVAAPADVNYLCSVCDTWDKLGPVRLEVQPCF